MKKKAVFIVLVLLCLVLQITIIGGLQLKGGKPDLLLILIVLWTLDNGWKEGLVGGFIAGLLEDILFSPLFGLNAFSLCLVGFLTGEIKERVYEENIISVLLAVGLASILNGGVLLGWSSVFRLSTSFLKNFPSIALVSALYNCLLTFFIFLIREKFWKKKVY
jgi:rod shape-determining protein MreD